MKNLKVVMCINFYQLLGPLGKKLCDEDPIYSYSVCIF